MKKLGLIATVFTALLMGAAMAQTTPTPASTTIQNQASATYVDSLGNPQTTDSNLAITVVQAVYGFTITPNGTDAAPGQTQTQIPGSTVNFGYSIVNTGNIADTINLTTIQTTSPTDNFDLTSVVIYNDVNGNGSVDVGDLPITSLSLPLGTTIKNIIVSGVVPGTATSTQISNINLRGVSVGAPANIDANNVAQVIVINDADLTLVKTASTPVLNSGTGLNEITYGLTGSNAGSLPAKSKPAVILGQDAILITDVIPAGTTYVLGSATGNSGAPGTTSVVYRTGASTWSTTEPALAANVQAVGLLMRDALPANNTAQDTLIVGATYNLSFKVSIPASTAGGTPFTNTATLDYKNNGGTDTTTTSNTTTSNQPNAVATAVGPSGQPTGLASLTASYTDPVTGLSFTYTRSGDGATQTDKETVASAFSGTTVTFVNTVKNTGNTSSTFVVSFDPTANGVPANVLPSGYSVSLYQADGVTSLGSGNITLAAGATYNVVVKVSIPATATPNPAANITAVIKSTSSSNTDITTDVITAIVLGQAVDIRNNDSLTGTTPPAGTTNTPTSITTNPGASVNYPLTVTNNGQSDDSFGLSLTGLPAGATVLYYADTNGDGLPDGAPISSTTLLNPAQTMQIVAVVTVPAGTAPSTSTLNFTSTSISNPAVSDTIANTLVINAINTITFTPDHTDSVASPGTVIYSHTLANTGNSSANVTLVPASTGCTTPGFKYLVYLDNDNSNTINAGDTLVYDGSGYNCTPATIPTPVTFALAGNTSKSVLVQVNADAGLSNNTTDIKVITATATFTSGTATATVTDTTKIVIGKLSLNKTASTATARPRTAAGVLPAQSEITYTITASNIGSAALSDLIVFDPIPTFTDYKFGTATVTGCPAGGTCTIQYSTDNGSTWSATEPTASDANSNGYSDDAVRVTNVRVLVTGITIAGPPVVNNAFPPTSSIIITFTVSVR